MSIPGVLLVAALVVWCLRRRRDRRATGRVVILRAPETERRSRVLPVRLGALPEQLGRGLRAVLRRPADRAADRRWGAGALVAAGALVVDPFLAVLGVGAVAAGRRLRARAARERQRRTLQAALPDAVELLRLGAEVGLTVPEALSALVRHQRGPFADRVAGALAHTARGVRLADALEPLRTEPTLSALVDALIDAERYGTPLARPLDRLAVDARAQRRQEAEQAVRRLPVRMLFPLVLCILPALGVLAVVPILVVTVDGLVL